MLKSQRRSRRRLIRQNQHTAAEDDSVDFAHIVSPQKYCSTFAYWKTWIGIFFQKFVVGLFGKNFAWLADFTAA